jgi:hypothetical protein
MAMAFNQKGNDITEEEEKTEQFEKHTFFNILGKNKKEMVASLGESLHENTQGNTHFPLHFYKNSKISFLKQAINLQ